jgi:hypothetical protein
MSDTDTGGPAFPTPLQHNDWREDYPGMTLRDYFAANANEDDINEHIWKGFNETRIKIAPDGTRYESFQAARWTREQARYRYADAMLKARQQ